MRLPLPPSAATAGPTRAVARARRLTTTVVLAVAASAALTGLAVPATAAVRLAVSYPVVAGDGPGDLIRVTGTGFTPGLAVAVALQSPTATLPMVTVPADDTGTVVVPADTRVPVRTALSDLRVTMTGVDGISAMSPAFGLASPRMAVDTIIVAGEPAMEVYVAGLANGPDTVRTVTIDGQVVSGTTWYADARAFDFPHVRVPVPASLLPGEHTVTLRQTGPTPFVGSATGRITPPSPYVALNVGPHETLTVYVNNQGWDDVFDVTIVGAAGDRHVSGPYTTASTDSHTSVTLALPLTGTSVGRATLTTTSRHSGAVGTVAFRVNGATIQAPDGMQPGEILATPDLRSKLKLQIDGNLVLYRDGRIVWTSGTPGYSYLPLSMRPDGDVVTTNGFRAVIWRAGTAGIGAGARFGIDAYGDVAVFAASGRQAWSSLVLGPRTFAGITANRTLFRGQALAARTTWGGTVAFTVQPDGNVVVSGARAFSTRTQGHPNAYLLLQSDGQLVVKAANGTTLWSNGVRATGVRVIAQPDGNIVEYGSNGTALWASGTAS